MFRVVKQHDEKDCGAACLAMIARYYGLSLPLSQFRELTKTDSQGTSLLGLAKAAELIGLKADALNGSMDEFIQSVKNGELTMPIIAHVNQNGFDHYVVVTRVTSKHISVADPEYGKIKYSVDTFAKIWSGYILDLKKTVNFKKEKKTHSVMSYFLRLLSGQYRMILCVFIVAIIVTASCIATAFAVQFVIDMALKKSSYTDEHTEDSVETELTEGSTDESWFEQLDVFLDSKIHTISKKIGSNISNISVVCMAAIVVCLLQGVLRCLREYLLAQISKSLDMKLLINSYAKMIRLPMSFFSTLNIGDIISRFSDTAIIRETVASVMLTIFLDSILAIGCGILLASISIPLFLVALGTVALHLVIMLCYMNPIYRINHSIMSSDAAVMSHLKESAECMETIKVTHSEETVFHTAYGKFMTLIKNVYKGTLIYASKLSSTEFISNISTILIFWFGASLITSNRLTVGTLISFYMIMSFFTEPIQRLIDTQQSIQSAGVALERLEDILQSASEENVDTSYSIVPETELKGDISIDNIVFRYGNRNTVLQNTSLHISANSCIAIVGESGSGKTTLARLLLRFYQPESGSITIDDKPIESFPLDQLRNDIAYISQNPQFFTGTIRYNLNLSGNHSDEQLIQMCSRCHLDSFISSQPNGLDFMIEESGKNLSAGQKQRLAIARALLQKPHILILDEATSNLDTLTEQSIQALLTECKKDLTIIVIAHRLSTIRNCDHIFVLSKGTIVEEGSHDELMKANGTYASFWHIP